MLLMLIVAIGALTAWYTVRHRTAEPPYEVGLVTWIGYAPLYIAKENGYFDAEHLQVNLRNMNQPGAREAAFSTGRLDFFPNTPDAFITDTAVEPLPGKVIAAFDRSYGADGIVVRNTIRTAADLKGKTVGFEKGITSHFLLLWYLHQNHLTGADIRQVSLSADDAGQSFMAGHLDAAATWEPWLSKARMSADATVLADSSQMNDRIVDVLMVSNRVLREPEVANRFMRAWYRGLDYLQSHADESDIVLGRNWFNSKPEEVRNMRSTVRFMSEQESTRYIRDRLPQVGNEISDLYRSEKLIDHAVDLRQVIDPQFIGHGLSRR